MSGCPVDNYGRSFSLKVSEVQYQCVCYFVQGFRIPTIYLLRPVVPSKKLSRKNADISRPLTAVVPIYRLFIPSFWFSGPLLLRYDCNPSLLLIEPS